MASAPVGITQLQADALAAADALRTSENALVEVLRGLRRRQGTHADADLTARELRVERQLRALVEVAASVAGAFRLTDVLDAAAERALEATGAASLSISRWERATNHVRTLVNVGELAEGEVHHPLNELYAMSDFPEWQRVLDGVPQINAVDDPGSDPGQRTLLRALGKESSIGVAIIYAGDVWGELWATTAPGARRFTAEDAIFLQTIADQIGCAISRAELFDKVTALAYRDPLTDLANRRALEDAVDGALADTQRVVTLLVCDVDGLKGVNDRFGHDAGDAMLRRAAHALERAAMAEPAALVSRIGGDEFCVLLPGAGVEVAERVAREALDVLAAEEPPMTLSCGAACTDGVHRMLAGELFRAADAAQYQAKHGGCGLICVVDPGVAPAPADVGLGARRRFRDMGTRDAGVALREALAQLDGRLREATVLERIDAVVTRFALLLDGARWAITFAATGAPSLQTLRTAERSAQLRFRPDHEWLLDEYPLSAAAVREGTGFYLTADDPRGDAAERALLRRWGFDAVLAAAAPAPDGVYLTEIYLDRADGDAAAVLPELRLSLLAAVAYARGA